MKSYLEINGVPQLLRNLLINWENGFGAFLKENKDAKLELFRQELKKMIGQAEPQLETLGVPL